MSKSDNKLKAHATKSFAVLDLNSVHVNSKQDASKRQPTRANKESGERIDTGGLIGGAFTISQNAAFIKHRSDLFDAMWKSQQDAIESLPNREISIVLPNGDVKTGIAGKTTAYDIAKGISQGLADNVVVAKVTYTGSKFDDDAIVACDDDVEGGEAEVAVSGGELWDLNRPLVGNCNLVLLKYDDPESKTVFAHSSAHILGAALEAEFGSHLTIGPPLQNGFYYDSYMGNNSIGEADLKKIEDRAGDVIKKKYPFQRLVVSKEQALEIFKHNPFKASLISKKVPNNSKTTVYRCGPLVDLCMGPHLPNTGRVKAFACVKSSSTNWLGVVTNDPLQRVYGVSFPDKAQLKQYLEFQEKAKQRDHRLLGNKQELFFFHQLSPGSSFWLPHGARVYNKLIEFIRKQLWARGYEEVITPNVFNLELWNISGHAQHYKENMFIMDVEGAEWGMKPMNCPGHCLMFAHRLRSYRELPLRLADFGVLHRNELSGALTGLTRVRRFQQDDGHIFCRVDQIKQEIAGALDFMRYVYTVLGMTYKLELSTRPEKALGDVAIWDMAEKQLAEALDEFVGAGNWRVNPGDGAFYGPKIDIKVFDALERIHQCATVQLDFQLPIRFGLEYKASGENGEESFQRPVMIHRAMLGSVERMAAVLIEHFGGKWPFWLSPRQVCIVPVDPKYSDYGAEVQQILHSAGFYADLDESTHTLNKKIREAQLAQYNFILVVGQQEMEKRSVMVRVREGDDKKPSEEGKPQNPQELMTIEGFIAKCQDYSINYR